MQINGVKVSDKLSRVSDTNGSFHLLALEALGDIPWAFNTMKRDSGGCSRMVVPLPSVAVDCTGTEVECFELGFVLLLNPLVSREPSSGVPCFLLSIRFPVTAG